MKLKLIILFVTICSITSSFGQQKKLIRLDNFDNTTIRYGYYLGLHYRGYELKGTPASNIDQGAGFQLGVLAELALNKHTSIITEPGVISTTNGITFNENANEVEEFDISTTHFHLPFSIKFKTDRINNVRGYIQAGASYNYNFSTDKNKGDNGNNPNDFLLTKHNIWGELTIGANFYFPYFKFSPSLRGVYGFNNEFEGLGTTAKNSISSLKTRGVFLTFIFQ